MKENKERVAEYRSRKKKSGLKRIELFISPKNEMKIRAYAAKIEKIVEHSR